VIGSLVGAHGIQGELKLRPVTEFPDRIARLRELRLRFPRQPDRPAEVRRLRGMRTHHEMYLVRLEGVEDRNAAEALLGAEVWVPTAEAAPLPPGRYYEHQLVGLRVVTPAGDELGVVSEVIAGHSNDVYVAGELLIPATHDAIVKLAPEEGLIVVRSREYLEGEEVR
jgi:16S rRNA processing protein RimM